MNDGEGAPDVQAVVRNTRTLLQLQSFNEFTREKNILDELLPLIQRTLDGA